MSNTKKETVDTRAERKSKQFWAVDENTWEVKKVTGYECPPNENYWWVPELGYSMSDKHHLFKNAESARRRAISDLQMRVEALQSALSRLKLEQT